MGGEGVLRGVRGMGGCGESATHGRVFCLDLNFVWIVAKKRTATSDVSEDSTPESGGSDITPREDIPPHGSDFTPRETSSACEHTNVRICRSGLP